MERFCNSTVLPLQAYNAHVAPASANNVNEPASNSGSRARMPCGLPVLCSFCCSLRPAAYKNLVKGRNYLISDMKYVRQLANASVGRGVGGGGDLQRRCARHSSSWLSGLLQRQLICWLAKVASSFLPFAGSCTACPGIPGVIRTFETVDRVGCERGKESGLRHSKDGNKGYPSRRILRIHP